MALARIGPAPAYAAGHTLHAVVRSGGLVTLRDRSWPRLCHVIWVLLQGGTPGTGFPVPPRHGAVIVALLVERLVDRTFARTRHPVKRVVHVAHEAVARPRRKRLWENILALRRAALAPPICAARTQAVQPRDGFAPVPEGARPDVRELADRLAGVVEDLDARLDPIAAVASAYASIQAREIPHVMRLLILPLVSVAFLSGTLGAGI